ncbi:MAG TPA: carbohydrate kinase family protein [Candidatus Paceibacterota bacterium]
MSKVIVSGSVAFDRIMDYDGLFAEHFVPDKLHSINLSFIVDKSSVEFGGTAGNIAYNLALLGEQSEIIATAGTDFSSYKSHLLLSGVDARTVRMLEGEMTSSAIIFTDKADNQIAAFHPGAGAHAYDTPVETEGRALAIIAPGNAGDMAMLPAYYRKKGMKYLYDPGQQIPAISGDSLRDGITGASILFASDYEFGLIAQKTGWAENEIIQHCELLVVTYGAEGSRIVGKSGETRIAAVMAEKVVDPTGAGDAYRSGFIKGLLAALPLSSCAEMGSVVASFAIEVRGTQNHKFTMDELKRRHHKTYGGTLSI